MVVAFVAAILFAGCNGPLRRFTSHAGCGQQCGCGDACCEPPVCDECDVPACGMGFPYCAHGLHPHLCEHAKMMHPHLCEHASSISPTKHVGCLLHFCEQSDYVGPSEPPRPPRFHPVPTHAVFAEGLEPAN
jgi:hypothetical protein